MKLRSIFLIFAIVPLLCYCGGKEEGDELPPPVVTPTTPDTPDDPDDPDDGDDPGTTTPPGAWEANRGKDVNPAGKTGWTTKTVRTGIVFYSFSGTDPITNTAQEVRVVDVDLSNPAYDVKLTYTNPSAVTSTVHKTHNSIATINAGYEAGSIYIRVNGSDKSALPNTSIGSTGVLNWKSEAALFGDTQRSLHISTTGDLIRPYKHPSSSDIGKLISAQRMYCFNSTDKDVLTSSPMLVDDYNPVGETFVDYSISNWTKLNSEEPQYHQRHRHPRTAVGLTEKNHFLMVVVDGRQTNAKGMSAKELTQFMVANFNPQYALNLDGGGSTAMCIEGLGTANTHLVNSPIQDNKPGNERARDTHIVIVEAK